LLQYNFFTPLNCLKILIYNNQIDKQIEKGKEGEYKDEEYKEENEED
jgi:hypothetical protein